ncbi:4-hydroxythreonine-4-phosphate dehydrogenase PdxA [Ammoniphilus sp. 3BR4]|uniref:4-hydroxythreonine-4-phosphate dehydrogenase PdxA n=1 Tax=Ammoniphilus sp. 3BR4 TaxID=3158265 RepID=UPI00346624B7
MSEKPVMALLFGEATGIGSELVIKAFQLDEVRQLATWVLIGDERVCKQGEEITGLKLSYQKVESIKEVERDKDAIWMIDLKNLDPSQIQLGTLSVESGRVTGETLEYAMGLAKANQIDGIVYAPLNKEALHRGGYHFEDEIHFFADLLDCKDVFGEINLMDNLWVTRVTSHIPLKEVSQLVTKQRVVEIIQFAQDTLTSAGYENPRIVVAALNPHAGDGGLMGMEEIEEIVPAVKEAQQKGVHVSGPFPADTIFRRLDKEPFDCLVGMYHDQAQTGMKLLGFTRGVTISGGLPVVLTTPAHGTAFDIAGQGMADPGAQIAAMKTAVRLVNGKKEVAAN